MLSEEILREIEKIPVIDVHTHLHRDRLAAQHPADFMLYHMLMYELCAAGAPADLVEPWHSNMGDRDETLKVFLPYFERISNTGFAWCLRTILRDLYEFDEPITADCGPRLRAAVERKTARSGWAREVTERGNIVRSLSSNRRVKPLEAGQWDGGLQFTFERLPLNSYGYSRPHFGRMLSNLERTTGISIDSGAAMQEAFAKWFDAEHLSDYRVLIAWMDARVNVSDGVMKEAGELLRLVKEGAVLSETQQESLSGAILRAVVGSIQGKVKVFQYVIGSEWIETGQQVRLPVSDGHTRLGAGVGALASMAPSVHFDVLNGYEPAEPVLCSVAARMPNVSLSSMWWHEFYPSVIRSGWQRRIDMVPWTGLSGFFSDAYCVEWQYAKLQMVRRMIASVLAERIELRLMSEAQAIEFARRILFETPKRVFLGDQEVQVR